MSLWGWLFGEIEEETQYRPDSGKKKFKTHNTDSFQEEDLLRGQREQFDRNDGRFGGNLETAFDPEEFDILQEGETEINTGASDVQIQEVNKKIVGMLFSALLFFGFIFIIFFLPFLGWGNFVFPAIIILIIIFNIFAKRNKSSFKRSWKM
ncbi:MAG: hypothetical protein ABID38_02060 [Candidatus Diapherotrites archaeon]